ncbi:hypothetical protein [Xenorhabdus sp. KJ12.1]|uniref:hypothetical protein n=1 Tax=Xenorhabdus sp. KJ12.1 TaxID=1851571 RepID=UPI00187C0641|nr:hypothetical protein [Xenorhabdus sp. KJ12.1]
MATEPFVPGCEAAYLTLFASGVKRLFRFPSAGLRGVLQLSVGQWWRIIGSFSALTIVFLKKIIVCCITQQKAVLYQVTHNVINRAIFW